MTNINSAIDVMGVEITEPSTLIIAAINLHRQRLPLDVKVDYGFVWLVAWVRGANKL